MSNCRMEQKRGDEHFEVDKQAFFLYYSQRGDCNGSNDNASAERFGETPSSPSFLAADNTGIKPCGVQNVATETATEIIRFLSTNPSSQEVFEYSISERAQLRLRRLLALNEAGALGEMEQLELDELQQIEHIMIMLKAQITKQLQHKKQCH